MRFRRSILLALVLCVGSISGKVLAQGLLPKLISERRLNDYLGYLTISDEQRAAIAQLRKNYEHDWDEQFGVEISSHNANWNATFVRPDMFVGNSMEESFRAVLKSQERLRYGLQSLNDDFFDQIELLLADDQLPLMQRVRLAHERVTYRRSKRPPRERNIDIVELAEKLALSAEDRKALGTVLLDYEPVFVQALREAAEADSRAEVYAFRVLDIDRMAGSKPDERQQMEIDRVQEQGERVRLRSSRRLVQVIRNGLQLIKQALFPAASSELQKQYDELAYPEIFPDPAQAAAFYDEALDLQLDQTLREALLMMKNEYVRSHESLSRQFAKLLYDHSCIYFKYDPNTITQLQESHAKMRDIALKREQLNVSQVVMVRALLTPDQNAQLKPWPYEKTQPPRPWAQLAGLPDDPEPRTYPKTHK